MTNETESLSSLLARLREQEPEWKRIESCIAVSSRKTIAVNHDFIAAEIINEHERTRSRLLAALEALEHMLGYINILRDTKKHSGSSNLLIGEITAKLAAVLKEE